MRIRRSLVALALFLIGFWGCSGDSDNGGMTNTDETGVTTPGDGQPIAPSPDTTTSPHSAKLPAATRSPAATTPPAAGTPPASTTPPAASTPPAATTSLDLSYISADFGIAVILRPAAILGTDLATQLPTDLLSDKMVADTAINPHDLEQVIVLLALPEGIEETVEAATAEAETFPERPAEEVVEEVESDEPVRDSEPESGSEFAPSSDQEVEFESPPEPTTGVILRSRTPFDKMGVLKSFFGDDVPELVEHDGKEYYKNVYNPSLYFPDEKTLVLATTSVLPAMMSAKDVDSPLIRQLKITDVDHDAVLVAVTEPFQETMEKLSESEGIPPALADVIQTLVFNAAAVTASLDVAGDPLFCATLQGKDDVGARNLEVFVRTWFESGRQMFADLKDEMSTEMPLGLGGPLVTVGEQIVAGIRIEKKGMEVVAVLDRPPALDHLPEQLGPAIDAVREQTKMAARMNNLRYVGTAFIYHELEFDTYPPRAIHADDGTPLLSWRVAILPLLDQQALYERFKLDEPWDSPHNIELLKDMPDCFSSEPDGPAGKTRLLVFTGEGTPFNGTKGLKSDEITDGTSNTILLVEAGPDKAVPWTKPEDLPFDPGDPLKCLGNVPEAGFSALFFDGHVSVLSPSAESLKAMISPAGGETVEE